jgi:hypothetical protein
MIRVSPSTAPFNIRDSETQRQLAQRVQIYDQVGKIAIVAQTTADETTVEIQFVNVFIEEPLFTYGSAWNNDPPYQARPRPTPGSYPTLSATVHRWIMANAGPTPGYSGAILGVVTTGSATQVLNLHYSFRGRAISVPAGAMPTTTSGLSLT